MSHDNGMLADLLHHSIIQFDIACRMGLSEEVIYQNSPTFVREIMSMFKAPISASVTITDMSGGGWSSVTQKTITYMCILSCTYVTLLSLCGLPEAKQTSIPAGIQHRYVDGLEGLQSLIQGSLLIASSAAGGLVTGLDPDIIVHLMFAIVKSMVVPFKTLTELVHARDVQHVDELGEESDGRFLEKMFHVVNSKLVDPHKGMLSDRVYGEQLRSLKLGNHTDFEDLLGHLNISFDL